MTKRLLFGTTNPTRLLHTRTLLEPLPLHVLSLADVGLTLRVAEDGATPAENAAIKAKAYFAASGLPTLAIDAGLTMTALPADKQPGVLVRRFRNGNDEATDDEMLAYYQQTLEAIGGQSAGQWIVALALALVPQRLVCETFTIDTHFTAVPSPIRLPGEPLSSLQIDLNTGNYYAELSPTERFATQALRAQKIFGFVQQHLADI
jgi:XTP/dITP diphosphohydrolase